MLPPILAEGNQLEKEKAVKCNRESTKKEDVSLQSTTLRVTSLLVPCERKEDETSKADEFFKDAVKIRPNLNLPSDVSKPSFWMNLTTVASSLLPDNPFAHAPTGQNEKPKGSRPN